MTFVNYKNSNNASSKLIADVSASATTLLIESGDEAIFPNEFPYLLTIEKTNSDWAVILREIVKVTSKTQNSFEVVRWSWTCVQDDTASPRTQGNTAHSFASWDRICLYRTSEQVKDIQDELNTKLSKEEYISWNYVFWASTTWNDDYSITLPYPPTAYEVWQIFRFLAWTENTWPSTLNVNWLWAVSIVKNHDVQLDTWDIEAWQIVEVAYDWTNFQMNSQTATIVDMKDIKTLSFSWLKAWEDLQEWDVVQLANGFSSEMATESLSLWWVSWLKWAIWFEGNWDTIQDLTIKASIVEWKTPTAITVNLESDNDWEPSWTVLWTADIINNMKWNFNISSLTETYTSWVYWWTMTTGCKYFWWWNRWKTRCFYRKDQNRYISSTWSLNFTRNIISAASDSATPVSYTISWTTIFWMIPWLTWSHSFTILYIDQDFKFMFIHEDSTKKIYKFWFNAPESWWTISSLIDLWSRSEWTVWINYVESDYMIAFSDDWMLAYVNTSSFTWNWYIKSFSLSSPYDFTWCTEIWTSWDLWSTWSNSFWPCYISLSNWKNYIVARVASWSNVYAREINSDWTIWSTNISITNRSSYKDNWLCVRNFENWWAAICLLYQASSTIITYLYTLWESFIEIPSEISFSLWNAVATTNWNKYRLTITPTWSSVEDLMNIYSYWWEENTDLANYTNSWSSISNRSPFIMWEWVNGGVYIVKQFEENIPFWNYWIVDNNYQAFWQARFVNMWISNHNSWLITLKK